MMNSFSKTEGTENMVLKRISELTPHEKQRLHTLIDTCSFSTPFHHIEWLSIIEKLFQKDIYYLFHYDKNENVDFALPFLLKKEGLYWDIAHFSYYELMYGGPLFCTDNQGVKISISTAIEHHIQGVKSISMTLPPKFPINRCTTSCFVKYCDTPLIDLRPDVDTIWKAFPYKNVRCNINKAYKNNVTIEINNIDHLEMFHTYHGQLLKSVNKPLLPLKYYTDVAQLPYIHIISALHNNYPIAVAILATHRDTVFYWHNASSVEHRNYRPNDLLVWEIIKWAKEHNFKYFDFIMFNINELPGVTRFKLKFGGEIYPIYQYLRSYSLKNLHHKMNKYVSYISHPRRALSRIRHLLFKS